jgi:predicted acylesterase/phospholipase RssA
LRALRDHAIPVDCIGGTSSGAIAAAFYALELDYDRAEELARQGSVKKRIFDYTLPLTSLLASAKVTSLLQSLLGESCIEDLWVPFFCVSSNLSRAAAQVHEQGPLWLAVRASSAIPGIFSPVLDQGMVSPPPPCVQQRAAGYDVLVDGGINNFPVDILRQQHQPGFVIGVDLSPSSASFQGYDFGPSLFGWRLLWQRLNPFTRRLRAPSLMSLLTRTIDVQSIANMRTKERLVDLLIKPDAGQIGLDDYDSFDEANAIGYQATCAALAGWDHKKIAGLLPSQKMNKHSLAGNPRSMAVSAVPSSLR